MIGRQTVDSNLHLPLGQNRKAATPKRKRLSLERLLTGLCTAVVLGLSVYATLPFQGLQRPAAEATAPEPPKDIAQAEPPADAKPPARNGLPVAHSRSGANVEATTTDDGSVVTKYTPKSRESSGPVLVGTDKVGQDPRMAAMPNDSLLEDTPEGRLPIVGPDGMRPVDHYARPWSGARATRVAIVVGGLGLSQTGTQRAIKQLPEEITLAFAASGNSLQRWMQEARRNGHEILLQVPLEPFDYPDNDPGPDTLLTANAPKENLKRLHRSMAKITNYTGVMNYLGGRFLSNADALEPVMRDVAGRGLLFLDDGSSAQTLSGTIGKTLEAPQAFADLQLDGQVDETAILTKLDELERIAHRNGSAIGVASAFDESIAAISKWSNEAATRGIEIVGVASLATDR